MNSDPRSEILERLHCAVGRLNALIEMTEAEQPCAQVLLQLYAVKAALHGAGVKIIENQAQLSQDVILNSSSESQRIEELKRLEYLYAIFLKLVSRNLCHSEGAFAVTEESLLSKSEILRSAQDDIFEMTYKNFHP